MNKFFLLFLSISFLFSQNIFSNLPDNLTKEEKIFLSEYVSTSSTSQLDEYYHEYNVSIMEIMINYEKYSDLKTALNIIRANDKIMKSFNFQSLGYNDKSISNFEDTMKIISNLNFENFDYLLFPSMIVQYSELLSFTIIMGESLFQEFSFENTFLNQRTIQADNMLKGILKADKWRNDKDIMEDVEFSQQLISSMVKYATFLENDMLFDTFEDAEKAIRSIFSDVKDKDFTENLISSYLTNVMPFYAWQENSHLQVTLMTKPIIEYINEYPTDPLGYLRYLDTIDIIGSNLMEKEDQDDSLEEYSDDVIKLIEMYKIMRDRAYNNVFDDITIKDIQNNPEFFSHHMRLAKLFQHTILESCDGQPDEISQSECRFNYLLKQIIVIDRINNILMEKKNDQLYIKYQNEISQRDIDLVTDSLLGGYKDIIVYQLNHNGQNYEPEFTIYVLQSLIDDNDIPFLEINKYFAGMDGSLFSEYGEQLIDVNEEVYSFFYDENDQLVFEEKIKLFESLLTNNIEAGLYQSSTMFYQILLNGIKTIHEDLSEDLVIIPDPSISNIPFELLTNSSDDLMMLNEHIITYSNSLYQYHLDTQRWSNKWSENQSLSDEDFELKIKNWKPNIIALGDIDYTNISKRTLNNMGYSILENLNWSDDELKGIDICFNDYKSTILSGENASETKIKNTNFNNIDYLHFSTHGLSLHDNHQRSSLIFSDDSINDGFLTYNEILDLELSNLEFVFLSACDTNKGQNFRNINLISLQKAFKSAGARNVLSTLWAIDDRATSIFTAIFYEELLKDPMYPDFALSSAKELFIEKFPHPHEFNSAHYWAAFVNYGY